MSSLAGIHNIIADQGATFTYAFVKKDNYRRVVPLPNYSARMQIRKSITSSTVVLNFTTENEYITIDDERGAIMITVPSEVMEGVAPEKYVYDLEIFNGNGVVERLVMGSFTVRAEVTR
jgi:hypothetical protein